jgi:dienelactone hydrolase
MPVCPLARTLSPKGGVMQVPGQRVRAVARTTAFFLKVMPQLPSRPVDWLTPSPTVQKAHYPVRRGTAEGDLYWPGTAGPHPGMVVCLGVVPFGVEHPQVARLGQALARAGFAALMFWSPAMRDRRLDPGDVDDIASAYQWLIDRPSVDATRSGLLGTCVGGSFALMAAASAPIRDRVAFVAAFAPYSSMWTFAGDIASATRSRAASAGATTSANGAEGREPWPVDPLTRDVFVRSLESMRSQGDPGGGDDGNGDAVQALLTGPNPQEVETALRCLPAALRRRFDALSPLAYLADVRAPLIVLGHDRDDQVVPVGESRRLRDALSGHPGVHYTEFALFQHADPTKRKLPPLRLLHELSKFFRFVYPVFRLASRPTIAPLRAQVSQHTCALEAR